MSVRLPVFFLLGRVESGFKWLLGKNWLCICLLCFLFLWHFSFWAECLRRAVYWSSSEDPKQQACLSFLWWDRAFAIAWTSSASARVASVIAARWNYWLMLWRGSGQSVWTQVPAHPLPSLLSLVRHKVRAGRCSGAFQRQGSWYTATLHFSATVMVGKSPSAFRDI